MSARVQAIDGLRGMALIGIAVANVQWFSGAAVDPAAPHDCLDRWVTFGLHLFIDGKFYGVFSLLFGASFQLFIDGRQRCGIEPMPIVRRRILGLLVLGGLHATLVWFGDILSLYAVAALPLLALRRRGDRFGLWVAGCSMLAPIVVSAVSAVLLASGPTPKLVHGPVERLDSFATGTVFEVWRANVTFLRQRWVLALASGRLPRLLGLFVLGAVLIRCRPRIGPRGLVALFAVALTSNVAFATMADVSALPPSGAGVVRSAVESVAVPSGALAYVAVSWSMLERAGWLSRTLAAAGRLSATHYLAQSLIFGVLFYGVGLGLWGALGASASVGVALLVVVLQVAWSPWWLARFGLGPAERALRAFTRSRSGATCTDRREPQRMSRDVRERPEG